MRHRSGFALALALGVAVAVAATFAVVSRGDQPGLPTGELLRLEPVPVAVTSPLDDHTRYLSELLGGTRLVTDAEYASRFSPDFAAQFFESQPPAPADALNGGLDGIFAEGGTIDFVRVREYLPPDYVRVLGVAENGTPRDVGLFLTEDDKIQFFTFHVDETDRRRSATWESVLILGAGWGLITAAAVAWRYRAAREAWLLLAAALPPLTATLVFSNAGAIYTIGRVLPATVVALAVPLLIAQSGSRLQPWVKGTAMAAAAIGALAPFVRDSMRIGHPAVVGALTDNDGLYRTLLASSAGLTALALGGVGLVNIGRLGQTTRRTRPVVWITTVIAAIWAIAALGAALDYGTGDGTLALGPLTAIALASLALVPAVVVLRLVVSRWERPELAALVIDLESEGADLQPAIAKALDDPTLQVLTSPDGQHLLNETGSQVSPDEVAADQVLTRIQSGGNLIGGLVHTAVLKRDPDRLEAVAAAAGMAVQLSQLNQQVVAQLDEVNASRARILQASDSARRQVERDLHDGAQQRLVAQGLRLQRARRLATTQEQGELAALLEDATRDVRETIEEIRAVSRGRQPALLAERGLAAAVDALVERAPVPVHIEITAGQLPEAVERAAYFMIAEGLTNMAKHAEATKAHVSIARDDNVVAVTIRDNGIGGAKISPGSGLEGLNDRLAAAGGTFDISSGSDGTNLEGGDPVRVIIVDDSALVRGGLASLLADEGVDVVATFADASGVVEAVAELQPDVLIIDVRMPPSFQTEGLEVALQIRAKTPSIGILVLSQHIETRYAVDLLEQGAAGVGYLLKDRVTDFDNFLDALHRVANGASAIDPEVVTRLVQRPKSHGTLDRLTEREREVLSLMAQGHSNAAIAEQLSVNQRTAETHVSHILTKLDLPQETGIDRRVSAVILWLRENNGS